MRSIVRGKHKVRAAALIALLVNFSFGGQSQLAEDVTLQRQDSKPATQPPADGQVRIPNRASTSLFSGAQGSQKTEIRFDPATGMVTIKLLVQDPNGYFIPNIRRDNFVVYENGILQKNATVDVEHADVTQGLLLENGGRYIGLNRVLSEEVARAGRQLLDQLGPRDKIAIWKYGNTVEQVADFSPRRDTFDRFFYAPQPPGVSEVNLYDALSTILERIRLVSGRKAIVLISTGVDSFSKTSYEDILKAARNSSAPIYAIGIAGPVRKTATLYGMNSLIPRIDWKRAETGLPEIARVSGGRFYSPETTFELTPIYDDIMENLRVRYVISYKPSTTTATNAPRTVRVELANSKTGEPLQILDANGRTIRAKVIVQDTYVPSAASGK